MKQVTTIGLCWPDHCEFAEQRPRSSAAASESPHCSGKGDTSGTYAGGGDEEPSARQRVWRIGDEHGDQILAEYVGLDANAPCASEIGEYDRIIRRLADAEHARAGLLHIFVAGDL